MFIAVYGDRSSQGIHLSGRRPKFMSIGDEGPQPLWIMEVPSDAYAALMLGIDGETSISMGRDAEVAIDVKKYTGRILS